MPNGAKRTITTQQSATKRRRTRLRPETSRCGAQPPNRSAHQSPRCYGLRLSTCDRGTACHRLTEPAFISLADCLECLTPRRSAWKQAGHEIHPMKWYILALRRYGVLRGRSSRSEFWWFLLYDLVNRVGIGLFVLIIGMPIASAQAATGWYGIAVIPARLALFVRRLHDTNRSGWWLIPYIMIPVAGWAFFWYYCGFQRAQPGAERYDRDLLSDLTELVEKGTQRP